MKVGEMDFDIEVYTCTQNEAQIKARLKVYQSSNNPLLIVVHDPDAPERTLDRLKEIQSWGKSVEHVALYIPLNELKKDPLDAVWVDGINQGTTIRRIIETNQTQPM
jgi:hypothetical protein